MGPYRRVSIYYNVLLLKEGLADWIARRAHVRSVRSPSQGEITWVALVSTMTDAYGWHQRVVVHSHHRVPHVFTQIADMTHDRDMACHHRYQNKRM